MPAKKTSEKKKKSTKSKVETTWKDNKFLLYSVSFVFIALLILLSRLFTTLIISESMGLAWEISFEYGFLPVLGFNERNVQMFETMNTLSLVITTFIVFLVFAMVMFRKVKNKAHYKRYVVVANAWLLGVFISMIQFIVSLFLDKGLHFATNVLGLVPIFVILMSACMIYFVRLDKLDTKYG